MEDNEIDQNDPLAQSLITTEPDSLNQGWTVNDTPEPEVAQSRFQDFLRTHAIAHRSYQEVQSNWAKAFGDVTVPDESAYKTWQDRSDREGLLDRVRSQAEKEPVRKGLGDLQNSRLGQALPPWDIAQNVMYKRAMDRFQNGDPTGEDYGIIANYEKTQRLRAADEQGAVGKARALSLGAPAAVAEMLVGGKAVSGVAGAVMPAALAEGAGALPMAGRLGVRAGLATALFPTFGPAAVAETAHDPAQMPAALFNAFGKAAVMEAVGAVQGRLTPKIGGVKSLGVAGATGVAGEAAISAVNHALGLETGYGLLGDLMNPEKRGEGMAEVAIGALKWVAIAGASHGHEFGREAAKDIQRAVNENARKGMPIKAAFSDAADTANLAVQYEALRSKMEVISRGEPGYADRDTSGLTRNHEMKVEIRDGRLVDVGRPITFQEAQAIRRKGGFVPGDPVDEARLVEAIADAIPGRVASKKAPRPKNVIPVGVLGQMESDLPHTGPKLFDAEADPGTYHNPTDINPDYAPLGQPEQPIVRQPDNSPPLVWRDKGGYRDPTKPLTFQEAQEARRRGELVPGTPEGDKSILDAMMASEFGPEPKTAQDAPGSTLPPDDLQSTEAAPVQPGGQPGSPPAQNGPPLTPRQVVDGIEKRHGEMSARLADLQRAERRLRQEAAMGLPRAKDLAATGKQRRGLEREIAGVRKALDTARDDAAAEDLKDGRRGPSRPPQGVWDEIKAQHPDWSPERIGREAARRLESMQTDTVTGFKEARSGTVRDDAAQAAIGFAQTGKPAVYAEIDLANLGGINAVAGNSGANQHFKAMADLIRQELRGVGGSVELMRHGGDEMSAVVSGVKQEAVEAALGRAQRRIQEYAKAKGLADIAHPKYKNDATRKGTGIHFGTTDIRSGDSPADIYGRADKLLEERKVSRVYGNPPEAAGAVAPEGQAGGTPQGPEGPGGETGTGKPGAAGGPPEAGPAVTPKAGTVPGQATKIILPEGGSIPARYEVRDLGSVRASHQVLENGGLRSRVNAGEYPAGLQPRNYAGGAEQQKVGRIATDMAPAILVTNHPAASEGPPTITEDGTVLNGNGRQMGLERSATVGTYEKYKAELVRQAGNFGLDPQAVAAMERPALYRVVGMDPNGGEARQFAAAGNVSMTQSQSPVRAAASLGRLVTPDVIDSLRLEGDTTFSEAVSDPRTGKPFRDRLRSELPPQEVSRFFHEDGRLTDAGTELIRSMLLAKVLPTELIERMGDEMKGLKRSLEGSIPQMVQAMRDFPAGHIGPQLTEAIGLMARNPAMKSVTDADHVLSQGSLFGGKVEDLSPGGRMMLDLLLDVGHKPLVMRQRLSRFLGDLEQSVNGLFRQDNPDIAGIAAEALGVPRREGATFGSLKELTDAITAGQGTGLSNDAVRSSIAKVQSEVDEAAGAGDEAAPAEPATSATDPADPTTAPKIDGLKKAARKPGGFSSERLHLGNRLLDGDGVGLDDLVKVGISRNAAYTILEKLQGKRDLGDIGGDHAFFGRTYTRERMRQLAKEALTKLGVGASADEILNEEAGDAAIRLHERTAVTEPGEGSLSVSYKPPDFRPATTVDEIRVDAIDKAVTQALKDGKGVVDETTWANIIQSVENDGSAGSLANAAWERLEEAGTTRETLAAAMRQGSDLSRLPGMTETAAFVADNWPSKIDPLRESPTDALAAILASQPDPAGGPSALGDAAKGQRESDPFLKAAIDFVKEEGGYLDPAVIASKLGGVYLHLREVYRNARHNLNELSGAMGPRTTKLSRDAGEALARFNAAKLWSRMATPVYIDKVMGPDATTAERRLYGTAFQEMRHRYARANGSAPDAVTFVGQPESPLQTEADYQAVIKDPRFKAVLERWRREFVPVMEKNYRGAQGLDPNDPIDAATQLPGLPMNAKAIRSESDVTPGTIFIGGGRGNLKNLKTQKLGFAKQAALNAEAYDTDLGAIIENSLARSTSVARKAEMYRTLAAEGLASWDKPGQRLDGMREVPFTTPPRGTQTAQPGDVLHVREAIYDEILHALDVEQSSKIPFLTPSLQAVTRAALMSTAEATYHTKNLLTFMNKPGTSPIDLTKNAWKVVANDPVAKERFLELARIGAARDSGFESGPLPGEGLSHSKYNPLRWPAMFLDALDRTMRLTAADAFDRLARQGRIVNSETNKRDFINQLGQYNRSAQHKIVRFLRDTGIGPFATAGSNYYFQGLRSLTLNPGVKATSAAHAIGLRAEYLARTASVLSAVALTNYMMWGRADGDDKTPLGSIKTGNGKNGRTSFFDLTNLTGLTRGARQVGLLALAEQARKGKVDVKAQNKSYQAAWRAILHPAIGPGVETGTIALTGHDTMGFNRTDASSAEAASPAEKMWSALRSANPIVSAVQGYKHPGRVIPNDEKAMELLGPFGIQYRYPPGHNYPKAPARKR